MTHQSLHLVKVQEAVSSHHKYLVQYVAIANTDSFELWQFVIPPGICFWINSTKENFSHLKLHTLIGDENRKWANKTSQDCRLSDAAMQLTVD